MALDSNQTDFDAAYQTHSPGSKLVRIWMALLFVGLLIGFGIMLSNPDTLAIEQVRIEGDFTRLSPVDLQLVLSDKVRGGFFNIDVNAVRTALLAEPWVSDVAVKRIWPNALRVIVVEQSPVVRWGEKGLLNAYGEYFEPEFETIPVQLPLLSGSPGSEIQLLNRFKQIQKQMHAVGFNIASITLDERRSWSFLLANGIKIILGRRDFEGRFNRFLTSIPTALSDRVKQIAAIDMRYTNGFSIRWRE